MKTPHTNQQNDLISIMGLHLAPVVQRADNFIQWISRYPALQMYSKERFWQVFLTIPYLN